MKATLSNYRQSPRKVRLVTDLIKGKSVDSALTLLRFNLKRASDPLLKLIRSAVANAEKQGENAGNLVVKDITVGEGVTMHRFRAAWRGQASPIRKRASHVTVTLGKK